MIVVALFCTFLGLFFMQELAKHYSECDAWMNTIPRVLSTILLLMAGSAWTFYFIELARYG